MADRTLTINHADGGSETYTINRDKFAGVRTMTVDGQSVSVDHTAVPKEQSKETTFGGTQSITVNRDIDPLLKDVVGGAAAAYSLHDLNDVLGNATKVVRVRRSSDNAEKDFTSRELFNGTLEDWVNVGKDYVGYAYFTKSNTANVDLSSSFTLEASKSWSIKFEYIGGDTVTGLFGNSSFANGGFWFANQNTLGLTDDTNTYQALSFGSGLSLNLGQNYEVEFFNTPSEGVRVAIDGTTVVTTPKVYGDITIDRVGLSRGRSGNRVIHNVRVDLNGDGTLDYSYAGDGNQASNWEDRVGSNDGTPTAQISTYNNEFTDGFVETWYDQSGEKAADPENITGFTISGSNDEIDRVWSFDGTVGGKPAFEYNNDGHIAWQAATHQWRIRWDGDTFYRSSEDTDYPWEVTTWTVEDGSGSPTFSSFVGGSITPYPPNDAVQAVTANQPKIVDAGSLLNKLKFEGSQFLKRVFTSPLSQPNSAFVVAQMDAGTGNTKIFDGLGVSNRNLLFANNDSDFSMFANTVKKYADRDANENLHTAIFNEDSSLGALNGVATSISGLGSQAAGGLTLGRTHNIDTNFLRGTISELIFYNSDQSANRAAIETNINNRYNIY